MSSEMERILGLGPFDTERKVPGTHTPEGREFRYVSCDENAEISVMFKSVVRHVTPPLASNGGVLNEACVVVLPSGVRYFALSYKGDIDGWRKQIEHGATGLGLSLAEIQRDRIILADGEEVPLSECDIYFD